MRTFGFSLLSSALLVALAACNAPADPKPTAEQEAPAPISPGAAESSAPKISGTFIALSNTAMGITGDITIEPNRLAFDKGLMLATTDLATPDVTGIVGQTLYGETPPSDFTAELRRIESVKPNNSKMQLICGVGDQAATHIALSRNDDNNTISVVAFNGPHPPASAEAVCATFLYGPK